MNYKIVIATMLVTVALAGCMDAEPENVGWPTGVTKTQELGDGWIYFEMQINGQKQCFLYHGVNFGLNTARESLTTVAC